MENEQLILKKLNLIGLQINSIKENMKDMILSADDISSLDLAEKDFKQGKTRRL